MNNVSPLVRPRESGTCISATSGPGLISHMTVYLCYEQQGRRNRSSLVPRPHPLTKRNGLVNQVEFLGLAHPFATM